MINLQGIQAVSTPKAIQEAASEAGDSMTTAESYAEVKRRLREAVDAADESFERRLKAAVDRRLADERRRYYAGFKAKPEADPRRYVAAGFLVGVLVAFKLAYLFITQ